MGVDCLLHRSVTLDRVRIATFSFGAKLVLGGSVRGIRFFVHVRIDPSTFMVEFVQILLVSYDHFFAIVAAQINFAYLWPLKIAQPVWL